MSAPELVHEGWLNKRGEYIKNWRPRYFKLYSDGSFYGFKEKPTEDKHVEPINNFSVKGCQIIKLEKGGKAYSILIRCWQLTTLVERTFSLNSESDRTDWSTKIEQVANALKNQSEEAQVISTAEEKIVEEHKKITLDDFEMLKVLGKGTFGKVILGKEKSTGNVYAIKLLRKDVILAKDEVEHIMIEN